VEGRARTFLLVSYCFSICECTLHPSALRRTGMKLGPGCPPGSLSDAGVHERRRCRPDRAERHARRADPNRRRASDHHSLSVECDHAVVDPIYSRSDPSWRETPSRLQPDQQPTHRRVPMSPIPLPNQPYPEPTPADPNPGPARPPAPGRRRFRSRSAYPHRLRKTCRPSRSRSVSLRPRRQRFL
jgi:hypothetical protein